MMLKEECIVETSFKDGFGKIPSDYRHVLVAVDYSYVSARVFERAIRLVKLLKCPLLTIVHVLRTKLPFQNRTTSTIEPGYYDILVEDSKELFEMAKKRAEDAGIECETVLLEGDPAEEILAYVRQSTVDLIVIGSKEKVGTTALLGSVSSRISMESPVSVLIDR